MRCVTCLRQVTSFINKWNVKHLPQERDKAKLLVHSDSEYMYPGGGGHSGTEGGRTLVTYFAEEGVFFEDLRMSAIL